MVQFCRFVPRLHQSGAKVYFSAYRPLKALLQESLTAIEVVEAGTAIPRPDFTVPVMSLPHWLGLTIDGVSAQPYIRPGASALESWAMRLPVSGRLRVGICWASRKATSDPWLIANQVPRSLDTRTVAALCQEPSVDWYSLQLDAPPPNGIRSLHPFLTDFEQTSAAISQLDMVVAVDTAVAHLAGAMGKPVWLLLPYYSCWRWGADRDESPWYPTMWIFRQDRPGDWGPVIAQVRSELSRLAAED